MEQANRLGLAAHIHAIGNAGVRETLDATEDIQSIYKSDKVKNVITHCQYVAENDYERFAKLDVIVAANFPWPIKAGSSWSDEAARGGGEPAWSALPYRSTLNKGCIMSRATDYPCGGALSPLTSHYAGTHRFIGEKYKGNIGESLTRTQAIGALTVNGAVQMKQDSIRGTVEAGECADFVIYDKDVLLCDYKEYLKLNLLATYVNGATVFSAFSD